MISYSSSILLFLDHPTPEPRVTNTDSWEWKQVDSRNRMDECTARTKNITELQLSRKCQLFCSYSQAQSIRKLKNNSKAKFVQIIKESIIAIIKRNHRILPPETCSSLTYQYLPKYLAPVHGVVGQIFKRMHCLNIWMDISIGIDLMIWYPNVIKC